jgi:hypothetical protein
MNKIKTGTLVNFIHVLDENFDTARKQKPELLDKLKSLLFTKDYKGKEKEADIKE